MQEWQDLIKRLLLGTEALSTPLQSDNPPVQEFYQQLQPLTAEQQLLQALAGTHWLYRLGLTFEQERPITAHTADITRECSSSVASILRIALQFRQVALLQEAAQLLTARRQRLPHVLLPDILQLAEQHAGLKAALEPVMGERGRWLAQQNPRWSFASSIDIAELSGDALVQALRGLRERNDSRFHSIFEQIWPQSAARERAKLINLLGIGLQSADLDFLQRQLSDRSQQVRQEVTRLLLRLGHEASLTALSAALQPVLQLEKSGLLRRWKLQLQLPETPDPAWSIWGTDANQEYLPLAGRVGRKSASLYPLLALMPPARLCQVLSIEEHQWLDLIHDHDHADLLLSAWAQSALEHDDSQRLSLLLERLDAKRMDAWLPALLSNAQGECRQLLLKHWLQRPLPDSDHVLLQALQSKDTTAWISPDNALPLGQRLLRSVNASQYWHNGLQQQVDQLAFAFTSVSCPLLITLFENETPARLEGCLRWLRYRHQLQQELSS